MQSFCLSEDSTSANSVFKHKLELRLYKIIFITAIFIKKKNYCHNIAWNNSMFQRRSLVLVGLD